MTPAGLLSSAIRPALAYLPAGTSSPQAESMLAAIALQESGIRHRRQVGGPARGFWQFERAGVVGVMTHAASREHAQSLRVSLAYPPRMSAQSVLEAIEHNDILAAGMARLLLWTLPGRLPLEAEAAQGWSQYLSAWRPGRPRPETWEATWRAAWAEVRRTQRRDSVVTWTRHP